MTALSEVMRKRRKELGLTLAQIAHATGVTEATAQRWESGNIKSVRHDKIILLADILKVSPAEIMGWDETANYPSNILPMPEMRKIPRVGRIACGEPIIAEENIEDYDDTPEEWHADFSLICVGNSMSPKIEDGDIVAIRRQVQINNGEIAAVRIGDEATLKMVYIHSDYVELRPVNPSYPSIIRRREEMNEIRIEGKAVGLCRTL